MQLTSGGESTEASAAAVGRQIRAVLPGAARWPASPRWAGAARRGRRAAQGGGQSAEDRVLGTEFLVLSTLNLALSSRAKEARSA
jgi:hypothetical protein